MEQRYDRRKMRRRRRLIRRIIQLIYRGVVMGLVVVVLVLAMKFYRQIDSTDAKQMVEEGYPESLIELLEKNPEAKDFVLNYPTNKDKHPEIDLEQEVTLGTIPLFLQWDERWGYETYGSDFLAVTGCGPTCLSMVWCGLSGDTKWNPLEVAQMAQREGFYVAGAGSSWELMTAGAEELGLVVNSVIYDGDHIVKALEEGIPIICIMGPGDFTTSGHFIVLTGVDADGKVTLCDPNSKANSRKSWDMEVLIPQIKNLWGYSYDA